MSPRRSSPLTRFIPLLTVLIAFIPSLAAQSVDSPETAAQYKYAVGLIQRQLHEEAIPVLNRVLADTGHFSQRDAAIFWHAECQYRVGNFREAISSYERVLRQYPKSTLYSRAAYGLGWAYAKDNNPKSAVEAFAAVDPAQKHLWIEAQLKMAFLMVKFQIEPAQAEKVYEGLLNSGGLSIPQQYEAQLQLGTLRFKAARFEPAAMAFSEALRLAKNEEQANIRFFLGESYFRNRRFTEAAEQYQGVLTASATPELIDKARYSLAWCYIRLEKPKAAEPLLRLLADNPNAVNRLESAKNLIDLLMNLHQYQEAADTIKALMTVFPKADRPEFQYHRGLALSRLGEFPEALSVFSELLAQHPKHIRAVEGRYQMALINIFMGKFREALDELSPLLHRETPPQVREKSLYRTGECYMNLGNLQNARNTFERLLKEYPQGESRANGLYQLGEIAYLESRHADALTAFTTIVEIGGELAGQAAFRSGEVLMKAERYFDAINLFDKYLGAFPNGKLVDDARFKIGLCHIEMKDLGKALAAFSQLQDTKGYFRQEARFQIGEIAAKLGDFPLAIQQYKAILAEDPKHPLASRARRAVGAALFELKDYPASEETFRAIIKDYPATDVVIPESHFRLGKSLIAQNRTIDGVTEILKVPVLYPKHPLAAEAYAEVARAYTTDGRTDRARKMWQEVLRLQPQGVLAEEARKALRP
jgi:tetratricopeptide (TPR) repeat protein